MWKPVILDVECIVCNKSLQKINHLPRDNNCSKMGKIIKVNNNRRVRTPNWSLEEKQYLLELIKQHKDVVVTKTNNGPNYYEEKDVAWNEILRELTTKFGDKFNGSSITIKKVKTQWQNMKRIAREEVAHNGPMLQKYSRLSVEVCNIIDIIKDGALNNENVNESPLTANVEVKTEYIEEEVNQPSCSGINSCSTSVDTDTQSQNRPSDAIDINMNRLDSSTSSNFDGNEYEMQDKDNFNSKCNASIMTESASLDEANKIFNPLHREIQQFIQYTAAEKQIKLDSLKEERKIIRAMRETAELNKIIAEQRLKHVLWIKKQEMLYV